jgi:hypothetical protein
VEDHTPVLVALRPAAVRRLRTAKPEPSPVKRCQGCQQVLALSQFHLRPRGGQGVTARCKACTAHRYATETFRCSRCRQQKSGNEFLPGQSTAVTQPCKECRSSAQRTKTRLARIERGRAPYHILSDVDATARRAVCRECGPTHIYATGSKQGNGWRCGTRSDEVSDEWYAARADIVDKFASAHWHRVRDVRGEEMRGTCTLCGDTPVRWQQAESRFKCSSPARKARDAGSERRRKLLANYGLTVDDYERMNLEQDGRCAICGGASTRADSGAGLVVDHDHETGQVRQLLCNLCNTGLGAFRDSPAILLDAIAYLRGHSAAATAA